MQFTNIAPIWNAEGIEPTTDLKNKGFQAGYKPPADYFNYLFNRYTKSINEIYDKILNSVINIDRLSLTSDNENIYGWKSKDGVTLPYMFKNGSAVVLEDEIHIMGGSNNNTKHYKFNGTNWVEVSTIPYYYRGGNAVVLNGEIHLLGSSSESYTTKHYKFNGTNWEEVSTLPYGFSYGAGTVLNNEIHIMGGTDNNTKHYKFNGTNWEEVSTLPYNLKGGSAVVLNGEIHLLGSVSSGNLTKHYKFNGTNWEEVSTLPYDFKYGGAAVLNNEIHIMGSTDNNTKHYKFNGTNWVELNILPYNFDSGSAVVLNGEIHLLGTQITTDNTEIDGKQHKIYGIVSDDLYYLQSLNVQDENGNEITINGINMSGNINMGTNNSPNYNNGSNMLGNDLLGNDNQLILGHYNNQTNSADGQTTGVDGTAVCVGNGTSSTRANAFRVNYNGTVYGLSNFNSSGADFAEFREWLDGNENNEDRVGYFVTREGLKIRKANAGEYVAGVTSGNPCIVGNSDECWRGKYETDNFNRFIEETYEYEEEVKDSVTGELKTVTKTNTRYKINPNYDPEQEYIERAKRKEWAYVCMRGEIAVYDDGTCQVNEYCKVANGGIATAAQVTEYSYLTPIYRVVERVAENIIKIEY